MSKNTVPIFGQDGDPSYAPTPSFVESTVLPKHVLCFLAAEGSFQQLKACVYDLIKLHAPNFILDALYSEDGHDSRMSRSFDVSYDRVHRDNFTALDQGAVERHGGVIYVTSPSMTKADALDTSATALELLDQIILVGATAVKGESAGNAHGIERWRQLAAEGRAAKAQNDLIRLSNICRLAFVKRPIGSQGRLYSVGNHLVGLPDVSLVDDGDQREISHDLDRIGDIIAAHGIVEAISQMGGHIHADNFHEEDDFKFNPYGILAAQRRPERE
jgi:hypothetical protein